ncbi:MAG: DUF3368 domain-containing protein [Candidatus Solibacter usitatus]|nr:DUF3368 domain-containing protein [Candidatus Solibacter usitatus]
MSGPIAVADASPICYLILIGETDLLAQLFQQVLIPPEVRDELLAQGAPASVRSWAANPPAWITVSDAPSDPAPVPRLQAGERAAIALAQAVNADVILLDEKSARRFATEKGLRVSGVLGILADSAGLGLIDLATAFEKLAKTNFRYPPELLKAMLERFLMP